MTLENQIIYLRDIFIKSCQDANIAIAKSLGYPGIPGMPMDPGTKRYALKEYLFRRANNIKQNTLPARPAAYPYMDEPQNWTEAFFGCIPTVQDVTKVFYESKGEGFYNFYFENYSNLHFLPAKVSEFIQLKFNYCLDITDLEVLRQVLFFGLITYAEIVIARISLGWFVFINPYTFPLNYFVALVDWTEDAMAGFVPVVAGMNLTGSVLMLLLGKGADYLNNLVFTMPYLPGEGQPTVTYINGQLKAVVVYRYLPVLWYKHPIPNDLRQYWFVERPDILVYMQTAYSKLNIEFLPDEVVQNIGDAFEISPQLRMDLIDKLF